MAKCIDCGSEMKRKLTKFMGLRVEALHCPRCKVEVFTEDQARKIALALDARRLKKEYVKKAIKIGSSWGFTFPKDIVEVFNLRSKKLRIHADAQKRTIEIAVE